MFKIIAIIVQTAIPVDRSVDRKFKNKSRCRLSVDRPVDRNKQRAIVLQSGMLRSTAAVGRWVSVGRSGRPKNVHTDMHSCQNYGRPVGRPAQAKRQKQKDF